MKIIEYEDGDEWEDIEKEIDGTEDELEYDKEIEFDDENDDEIEDETLAERLWGLTEMFPEPLRNVTGFVLDSTTSLTKNMLSWSKAGLWVAASTFTILTLPIIIEQERSGIEHAQSMQSRELLLGPSAAASGSANSSLPYGLS